MNFRTLNKVMTKIPPEVAILLRGPTGIGKSVAGVDLAEARGVPFIDVRASCQVEGDASGYPDLEGMKQNKVSTMCMPGWFVRAQKEPVVLMLDELNRALPAVQQGYFQLVLDRYLGNDLNGMPHRLHPGTQIVVGVNCGSEYDVSDMDPALLRRFWVVDLEPDMEDWVTFAQKKDHDELLIDFIRKNPAHLRVDPSKVTPGTVVPCPASWSRLDAVLKHAGMAPKKVAGTRPDGLHQIAAGFVGMEASMALSEHIAKSEQMISAEDVLEGRVTAKRAAALSAGDGMAVIERCADHAKTNDWRKDIEGKRFADFLLARPEEQLLAGWTAVSKSQNNKSTLALHAHINMKVVDLVNRARKLSQAAETK